MWDRVQNQPPEVLYKKSCSKKICNIQGKTPELESLFNKAAGLKAYNFIKKRLQLSCFPLNIAKFLRTPILKNICKRLLHVTCLFLYLPKRSENDNLRYFQWVYKATNGAE